MPSYRASKPSLYGGVGAPNAPTGGVDVAGAIDALSGGAASLIHSAMLRHQSENAIATANAERDYQHTRDKQEDDRHAKELSLKQQDSDREFMLKGGVPAYDQTTGGGTAAVAMPQSPIRRAMTRPGPGALPAPSYTPVGPQPGPATAPLPVPGITEHVPEHVDASRSATYQQATDVARIRGEVQADLANDRAANQAKLLERRLQAGKESAVYAQHGRIELEKLRQAGRNSGIHRGMTVNAASKIAEGIADGIISSHEGDRESAFEWLNGDDPEAVSLRKFAEGDDKSPGLPLSWGTYLDNSRAKWQKTATSQALSFQHGPMADKPVKAAAKVEATRAAVAPPPKRVGRGATPKLPAGAEALAPPSPFDAASLFRKPAAAPAVTPKKIGRDTVPVVAPDDFSDDEIDAAIAAGHETDADVRKYILDQRKTSKKKKG